MGGALGAYQDVIVVAGFVLSFALLAAGFALSGWRGGRVPGENAFVSGFLKALGFGALAAALFVAYLRWR